MDWDEEITEIKVDDCGYVIASMNDIGVAKIEVLENGEKRIVDVDDEEPFVAAVSANALRLACISHMARTLHTDHQTLANEMDNLGIETAYDGMTVEF